MNVKLALLILVFSNSLWATVPASFFNARTGPFGGMMGIDAVPLDLMNPIVPPSPFTLRSVDPALYQSPEFMLDLLPTESSTIPDNSMNREFSVYLPPQICEPSRMFPVVYYLHGDLSDHINTAFQIVPGFKGDYLTLLDTMITQGDIVPMIVIFGSQTVPAQFMGCAQDDPDFPFDFSGADYFDSPLGMMETFHTFTLRQYVNANYPTTNTVQSTVIGGHSQGAIGTSRYPARHACEYGGFFADAGFEDIARTQIKLLRAFIEVREGWGIKELTPLEPPNLSCALLDTFAGFANQLDLTDTTNPGAFLINPANPDSNGINLSHDYGRKEFPDVIDLMKTRALTGQIVNNVNQYKKARIFSTQGTEDRNVPYFGAKSIANLMTDLDIDYRYLTHGGAHNTFTYPDGLTTGLSEDVSLFLFASACFKEDLDIDAKRIKLVGNGTIELKDNAKLQINNNSIFGVETNGSVTNTNIEICVIDNAMVALGAPTVAGGGLQIGNQIDPRFITDNPSLASRKVSFNLKLDGDNAQFCIGKQGFFGLGVGLKSKICPQPDQWVVTSLQNLQDLSVNIPNGMFKHNLIFTSTDVNASLLAVGEGNTNYSFACGSNAQICGGGNLIFIQETVGMHPTVRNEQLSSVELNVPAIEDFDLPCVEPFIRLDSVGGLHTVFLRDTPPPEFDSQCLGIPVDIVERDPAIHGYRRSVLASKTLQQEVGHPSAPQKSSGEQLFNFLSTQRYNQQVNKRANVAVNPRDGECDIAFADEGEENLITLESLGSIERRNLDPDLILVNPGETKEAITELCAATVVRSEDDGTVLFVGDPSSCGVE